MALGRRGAGEGLIMAYWLVKSEPDSWSWDDQVRAGSGGTPWTGVRNHAAKLNLMAMKKGDLAFFYHSNQGKAVVGVVEVIRESYPDPEAAPGEPWVLVDLKAVGPFPTPVTLDAAKKEPALAEMALVKFTRLSVQPVRPEEWDVVCRMGGYRP
jgi:predicted RNA-binding protein with PUA-like domain